jgi:FixJ family two-component response regulator
MPGTSGVQLLGAVRYSHPHVVRVLTTAYAELGDAIAAVNSGAIFAYVTKPWSLQDLKATIVQAFELSTAQRERDMLLGEKLGVLQRQSLLDRLRSASILAAALGGSLNNTTTAAFEFMDHSRKASQKAAHETEDVWEALRAETARAAEIARLVARVIGGSPRLDEELDTALAWPRAAEATGVPLEVVGAGDLPRVSTDAALFESVCRIVLGAFAGFVGETGRLLVSGSTSTDVWGSVGVCWSIACKANADSSELATLFGRQEDASGTPLLGAYFLLYHLGGRVRIAPDGVLSLELPLRHGDAQVTRPEEDWAEMLFEGLRPTLSSSAPTPSDRETPSDHGAPSRRGAP